ncbi:MAG: sugar transferase [Planctomycetaceae bacterium]
MPQPSFYQRHGKRWLDLAIAIPLIVVLSPLMGLLVLIIRWKLGTPVLFIQVRPGLNGQPFKMVKFRTMTDAKNERGELLPDEVRLTYLGHFLRASSLDELPELWNVVRGEMSLVGPRPLLTSYLELYSPEQAHRHDVLPGITGWAQVNGRNAISWEQKFLLDVDYVNQVSFPRDIKILILTIAKVIRRADISAKDHSTMPVFQGNPKINNISN